MRRFGQGCANETRHFQRGLKGITFLIAISIANTFAIKPCERCCSLQPLPPPRVCFLSIYRFLFALAFFPGAAAVVFALLFPCTTSTPTKPKIATSTAPAYHGIPPLAALTASSAIAGIAVTSAVAREAQQAETAAVTADALEDGVSVHDAVATAVCRTFAFGTATDFRENDARGVATVVARTKSAPCAGTAWTCMSCGTGKDNADPCVDLWRARVCDGEAGRDRMTSQHGKKRSDFLGLSSRPRTAMDRLRDARLAGRSQTRTRRVP